MTPSATVTAQRQERLGGCCSMPQSSVLSSPTAPVSTLIRRMLPNTGCSQSLCFGEPPGQKMTFLPKNPTSYCRISHAAQAIPSQGKHSETVWIFLSRITGMKGTPPQKKQPSVLDF